MVLQCVPLLRKEKKGKMWPSRSTWGSFFLFIQKAGSSISVCFQISLHFSSAGFYSSAHRGSERKMDDDNYSLNRNLLWSCFIVVLELLWSNALFFNFVYWSNAKLFILIKKEGICERQSM